MKSILTMAWTAEDPAAFDLAANDAHDELAAVHAGVLGDALALGKSEQLGHGQTIQVVESCGYR